MVNAAAGEACDTAGESATCNANCTLARCGDGIANPAAGEACDDGNPNNADNCLDNCRLARCGDGAVHDGVEACDDGDTVSGNGCSGNCTVEPGYHCTGVPSLCASTCGDGLVASDEGCDDGNHDGGDGCSA